MGYRTLLAIALAAWAARPASAQSMKLIDPVDSLRNMREMAVVVEELPATGNALRAETLEAAVKSRLRQVGIDVPAADVKDPLSAFAPYLYANINVITVEPDGYVYSISLQFKRPVEVHNVDRNRNFLFAPTWDKAGLAVVPRDGYASIRQALDEFVTAFLEDYASVNTR